MMNGVEMLLNWATMMENGEEGDDQSAGQEGHLLGLLFLLSVNSTGRRLGQMVAQLCLEGLHDFVGVVAFEHIGAEGHGPVQMLRLMAL